MAAHEAQMPFIRNLASSDRKLRTASLDSLKTFLSSRKSLSQIEALKLWKGLYFAHWMSDRPAPQQRLAAELALLADALPEESCLAPWFTAFWDVMGQQWSSIDKLRLDKFLLLVRRVFAVQIRYARTVQEVRDVLKEWPFEESGDLRRVPLGLRLHALDLWVDELEREGCLAEEDEEGKELTVKVGAMVEGLFHCPVKQVRERARDSHADERLPWGEKAEEDDEDMEDGSDDEWGGIEE